MRVRFAWRQAVHLNIMLSDLFRQAFNESHECGLGGAVNGEIGTGGQYTAHAADHDDLAAAPFDHLREDGAASIQNANQVGLDHFVPGFRGRFDEGPDGSQGRRGAYQHLGRIAELHPHPLQGCGYLFVIADIGAHAQGRAASVFDLQMAQVELGFAARQQSHARTFPRESDGQAFADSAARAGDQYGDCFERVHHQSR